MKTIVTRPPAPGRTAGGGCRLLATLVLLLMACGCVGTPSYPAFPAIESELAELPQGMGRVFVLRPNDRNPQQRIAVTLNGERIGTAEALGIFYADVAAGTYPLRARYGVASDAASVTVADGAEIYVEVAMRIGAYAGRPEVAVLDPEEGRQLAEACLYRGGAPVNVAE